MTLKGYAWAALRMAAISAKRVVKRSPLLWDIARATRVTSMRRSGRFLNRPIDPQELDGAQACLPQRLDRPRGVIEIGGSRQNNGGVALLDCELARAIAVAAVNDGHVIDLSERIEDGIHVRRGEQRRDGGAVLSDAQELDRGGSVLGYDGFKLGLADEKLRKARTLADAEDECKTAEAGSASMISVRKPCPASVRASPATLAAASVTAGPTQATPIR